MKGTYSQGKHGSSKNHIACRRCGRKAYHAARGICASCGYGKTAKMRRTRTDSNAN